MARSNASRELARARLAALGVPLFHARPRGPSSLNEGEYTELLTTLMSSGDARLRSSIPCLLAAQDSAAAARAARSALSALPADEAATLALLYRIARYLVRSRAPDLRHLRGRVLCLEPLAEEPDDLPDPDCRHGEAGLAAAAGRFASPDGSDLVGGAARTFDTWLRILDLERTAREPA